MDRADYERLMELFKENRQLIKEGKEKKQGSKRVPQIV